MDTPLDDDVLVQLRVAVLTTVDCMPECSYGTERWMFLTSIVHTPLVDDVLVQRGIMVLFTEDCMLGTEAPYRTEI